MEQDDFEDYGEHYTEESSRCQTQSNPVDSLYTREHIGRLGAGLRAQTGRILDSVLKIMPDHLKAKAEIACDALNCRDSIFINPDYEIIVNGTVFRWSNICFFLNNM